MLIVAGAVASVAFVAQCGAVAVTVTSVVGMSSMTTLGVCQTMRWLVKTLLVVVVGVASASGEVNESCSESVVENPYVVRYWLNKVGFWGEVAWVGRSISAIFYVCCT